MQQLKIKTESLPERCEICHQSDLFDPEANLCSRCSDIVMTGQQVVVREDGIDHSPLATNIRSLFQNSREFVCGFFLCAICSIIVEALDYFFVQQLGLEKFWMFALYCCLAKMYWITLKSGWAIIKNLLTLREANRESSGYYAKGPHDD